MNKFKLWCQDNPFKTLVLSILMTLAMFHALMAIGLSLIVASKSAFVFGLILFCWPVRWAWSAVERKYGPQN